MKRLLAFLVVLGANGAWACGVCIDDKVAACYDHAVVTKAHAQGHEVAFFAVQGPLVHDGATRGRLEKVLAGTPGVLKGTARVSVENAALSFAYDPKRSNALAIARELEKRLSRPPAEPALGLALLRVMN
jgi:hypothetical protein